MVNQVEQTEWKTRVYDSENARERNNDLDRDAFMKLLVTQLRSQDPLNPMEDREFISQMAQFSSLEQMQNLNESFKQNHEEIMEHMIHMNNNLVNSQTTIATQMTKMNKLMEAYLLQPAVPEEGVNENEEATETDRPDDVEEAVEEENVTDE